MADPTQTFAERLSLWMGWTDAISLSAALASRSAASPSSASGAPTVTEEVARVRRELAASISAGAEVDADPAATGAAAYAPYRRHHLAQQRAMENRIAPLRTHVRAALSNHGPELARLAALDAVLEKALAARERHLLSNVPALLEQHAARLRKDPSSPPAAWPAVHRQNLQDALLAELEIRLQPIEGMMEALSHRLALQP